MYRTAFKLINNSPALMLFIAAAFLYACEKPAKVHSYSIFTFGTLIDITLYDVDKQQAEDAFAQLQQDFDQYHQNWSPWTNGDLAQLNNQLANPEKHGNTVPVPIHLIPLIRTSMVLSQQSENHYNPGIGKLINLWQFHKYQDKDIQPPDDRLIQALIKQNPQMSDLSLDDKNQLTNSNPAVSLNFGAFAKGYAIGLEIKQLQKLNIKNAVINAGGDLSVIGQHGTRPWNIGIRHPREDSVIASIEVKNNESVFTSGDYERFYDYQNKRYHHIIDSKTGYPTQGVQSVTVLHQDAGRADAAATAIFVAGRENWQRIAKNMGVRHVMLIDQDSNIHITPTMEKRIKFLNKSPASRIIVSKEL
ncbi:MAG: FAD:protein FMN transferase [Gammaproteobacteria bacterium]|nr:FAD:protein FMN transferase [Gammaproteobacteria bacterium]